MFGASRLVVQTDLVATFPDGMRRPTLLVAPSRLEPLADDENHVRVVVETA
jgi:hypothetical protein